MVDKARRGSELVLVKAELRKEEKNGRRETGTLSRLKTKCISGVFHGAFRRGEDRAKSYADDSETSSRVLVNGRTPPR